MKPTSRVLAVTGSPKSLTLPSATPMAADAYLRGDLPTVSGEPVVLNLCRTVGYLSRGYYVSLMAEGRGHAVLPTVETLEEAASPIACLRALDAAGIPTAGPRRVRRRPEPAEGDFLALDVGEDDVPRSFQVSASNGRVLLKAAEGEIATCQVVLGRTTDPRFRTLAAAVYREFPLPIFLLKLVRDRTWKVCGLSIQPFTKLDPAGLELLDEGVQELGKRPAAGPAITKLRPSIACLFDPADAMAPCSADTLDRFDAAADRLGANFTVIGRQETHRLAEHDALFVRTLTGLDRWVFPVQQKAAALGLPVIDDPLSTIRCSNKIYLYELLSRLRLAQPRSVVVTPKTPFAEVEPLGFPLIVKLPDGSFSKAVKKATDRESFAAVTAAFFRRSPLLLVQEYCPSDFDWRVGVLGGRLLYACRYFMARGHWQILKTDDRGRFSASGRVEAIPRETLDPRIAELALAGAAAIGEGLYGVDLKETPDGPVIIEINDNPNIDEGYEDQAEKSRLYDEVIQWFLDRLEDDRVELPADGAGD